MMPRNVKIFYFLQLLTDEVDAILNIFDYPEGYLILTFWVLENIKQLSYTTQQISIPKVNLLKYLLRKENQDMGVISYFE
jgi:hypothetical protein